MSMCAFSSAFGVTRLVPFLNDDEDIVAAPDDVELFQSQPPVADAFAGLQLVFITVPRADEMDLVRERLALIGAVRRDHVDHAVDHEPLAGRPAGMGSSLARSLAWRRCDRWRKKRGIRRDRARLKPHVFRRRMTLAVAAQCA